MRSMSEVLSVFLASALCLGGAQGVLAADADTAYAAALLDRQGMDTADEEMQTWLADMDQGDRARFELALADQTRIQKEENEILDFKGLGFGPGIGLLVYIGDDKPTVAEVVNGVVRITAEEHAQPVIMLESHFFFTKGEKPKYGLGPFVSIMSSTQQLLDAFGLGALGGGRKAGTSFNLGVGIVWNRNVQVLGDGIEANQPLPAGETEIRYKRKTTVGGQLIASFAF